MDLEKLLPDTKNTAPIRTFETIEEAYEFARQYLNGNSFLGRLDDFFCMYEYDGRAQNFYSVLVELAPDNEELGLEFQLTNYITSGTGRSGNTAFLSDLNEIVNVGEENSCQMYLPIGKMMKRSNVCLSLESLDESLAQQIIRLNDAQSIEDLINDFMKIYDFVPESIKDFVTEFALMKLQHLDDPREGLEVKFGFKSVTEKGYLAPFIIMPKLGNSLDSILKGKGKGRGIYNPNEEGTFFEGLGNVARRLDVKYIVDGGEWQIVHRDVKPANILFDDSGNAHPLDFGISFLRSCEGGNLFFGNEAVGSLFYMSPEQLIVGGEIDPRSDQYAFGIVLAEALVGNNVMESSEKNLPIVAEMRVRGNDCLSQNFSVRLQNLGLDSELAFAVEDVINKALNKDKDNRYASSSALFAMLKSVLSVNGQGMFSDYGKFIGAIYANVVLDEDVKFDFGSSTDPEISDHLDWMYEYLVGEEATYLSPQKKYEEVIRRMK